DVGNNKAIAFRPGNNVKNDFDGDGESDLIVWRPQGGMWFILNSGDNFDYAKHVAIQLGLPGDVPLVGDFDGDGRADLSVWRPSNGYWFFRLSRQNYATITAIQWGLKRDIPKVGDFDGDGMDDLAVYRPSTGNYLVLRSASSFNRTAA